MNAKNRSYHTLRDFFMIIFKHKKVVVLFFMLSVVCAVLTTFIMTPVYEAFSKILVKSPDVAATPSLFKDKELTIETAVEILTGRFLLERVVEKTGAAALYPDIGSRKTKPDPAHIRKAALRFKENLSVSSGSIINVRFRHPDPEKAARAVNNLTAEFLDYYLTVHQQNRKYRFFKDQLALMEKKLKASQKELGLFRNEQNISSIQKQKSLLLLQISDLELELAKIRGEISEYETKAENFAKTSSNRSNIQQTIYALQNREKKIGQQITDYRLQLGRLDKAETRLSELERQVKINEENYLLYAKKTEEARISSAMDEQKLINFTVIEPASPPLAPVQSQKYAVIIIALLFGAAGGLFMAFVSEYFSHTFDRPEDVRDILGLPSLGCFPDLDAKDFEMVASLSLPEKIREKCNRMRHSIFRALADGRHKCFLFTAAKAGEGVTGLLINFALSVAESGESVIIIDANLRNPGLHQRLGLERAGGLTEVLSGSLSPDDAIRKTGFENLALITSGAQHAQPFSLLQSEAFQRLLDDLQERAGWILVDAPSTEFHEDACIIGARVPYVITVIRSGKTRWEVVKSSVNKFKQFNARVIGAVLNRQKMHIPDWLYRLL